MSAAAIPAYATVAELLSAAGQSVGYAPLDARLIDAAALPDPFNRLLDHTEHMTEILREFHGVALRLDVLRDRRDGDVYAREILLRRGDDGRAVEYGAVRIALDLLAPSVVSAVLARERPLGEVLIEQNLLRRVEPLWFFAFGAESRAVRALDGQEPAFGRVGRIHCDGRPAIEVLEVVTGR